MADFEEILKKITDNQDVMSKISEISKNTDKDVSDKLPDVIAAISPLLNGGDTAERSNSFEEKTDTPASKTEESAAFLDGKIPMPVAKIGEKITKNSGLLLALKPYLSKNRCDVVDSIVKMAQVADLMKLIR